MTDPDPLSTRKTVDYNRQQVIRTDDLDGWLHRMRDRRGKLRILRRIERLIGGNPGDARPIGGGLSELRIDVGPGYRVYYLREAEVLILLLCGGDKSTQTTDIAKAHMLADEWRSTRGAEQS